MAGRKPRPSGRRRAALRSGGSGADASSSSSSDQGSIIWTILLVGLIFCLADVAYILEYVDTQNSGNDGIVGSKTLDQRHHIPQTNKDGGPPGASVVNDNGYHEQGNDDHSPRMRPDEQYTMERQLHDHEMEIYGATPKPAPREAAPIEPLTAEERAMIWREKQHILDMLKEAKVDVDKLDAQTLRDLPTWAEIVELYGPEPRIFGLDQCEPFQTHSDRGEHFVSTAGTFNSGTNLMAEYLIANCHMQDRMNKYGSINRGIRWQVPWGKHSPPGNKEFRDSHKTAKDGNVDANNILPGVTIRDPYVWFHSMCRHEYASRWHHDPNRHCPNMIPDEDDLKEFKLYLRKGEPIPLHIKYNGFWKHHETLVGQWNDWYRAYWDMPVSSMGKLIVRYEDLLFHPRNVTESLCKCAGGSMKRDGTFDFVIDSAKKGETAHGPMDTRTGFVKALIKYGKAKGRDSRMTPEDLAYAKEHLDKEMMEFFRYKHPDEISKKYTT